MKKASGVLAGLGCKKTRRGAGMEGWLTVAHTYHAGALWAGSCAIIEAGRTATPGLALSDVPPNRVPRFHRMGRNFNLPT